MAGCRDAGRALGRSHRLLRAAEFLTGYQSKRPLTPAEAGWLDILLLWQGLAMVPPGDDPTGWGPSALSQMSQETAK